MKDLLILLIVLQSSLMYSQEINSEKEFRDYDNQITEKIKSFQEKEGIDARYKVIDMFEEVNRVYESLLQKDISFRRIIITTLIDNYTYCMRKYPDKADTSRILDYYTKARQLGLCNYINANFIWELKNSDIFYLIGKDSCINMILRRFENEQNLWSNKSFTTPYQLNISDQEKITGLSEFWSETKNNFAHFDKTQAINWDSLYISFIPKVLATNTTYAYYNTLRLLCAYLKDSHTSIYYPDELKMGSPPLSTKLVENKVFISEVRNDSLLQIGIKEKMEIVSINGLSTIDYAKKYVIPFVCSSTKQDLLVRTYEYELLYGKRDKPIILGLKNNNGKVSNYLVSRTLKYNIPKKEGNLEFKIIGNNIGYLIINSFSARTKVNKLFDNVFDQLNTTDGLIIDIRNNGGGTTKYGDYIFSCFINSVCKSRLSSDGNNLNSWSNIDQNEPYEIRPNQEKFYNKPVIILTGNRTISAAEDFCLLFDYNKRATIIGEVTAGSTGDSKIFNLPGGGKAKICSVKSYYPDGKEYVGFGIKPDKYIGQTIDDYLNGKDLVLKEALKELTKNK